MADIDLKQISSKMAGFTYAELNAAASEVEGARQVAQGVGKDPRVAGCNQTLSELAKLRRVPPRSEDAALAPDQQRPQPVATESPQTPEAVTEKPFTACNVAELRAKCKAAGLAATGKKADLIARLLNA